MSWDITLECEGEPVPVPLFAEGGTQLVGGRTSAHLNVTYNYYRHFDFKALAGRLASDTIPGLQDALLNLGVVRNADYWLATEGNVGYACSILLQWARQYPSATWQVV